ncbi:MAG: DUF4115 domain-containing protein [Chloroflexi bacterium]|nr:DUF4115 domain-containing protein [Chloroflexota bacterium]MBI3340574.1 DUF4115 domain-containing protein [Chloroflexota bacterium]
MRAPVWRAWLDSVAAKFTITANRRKPAQSEAEETRQAAEFESSFEPESNVLDFDPQRTADFPLPAEVNKPALSSEEIFVEIGQQLRKRREMLSLTYDEIERNTRVRAIFLKALEDGALESLPSPVQTRGILANYAVFLDLDVDTILLRFADGLQARHRERRAQRPVRKRAPMTVSTVLPPWRAFISTDLLFGGSVAILLALFAIWGIGFVILAQSAPRPKATAPSISEILVAGTPTALQEVTLIPAQDTLIAATQEILATAEAPTLGSSITVQINLVATARTYLRVTVDGKVKFDGRVEPGSAYPFDAESQIEVLVGNAAALKVTYNGRDLGLMGNFGEVIDRVYSAQGIATPTGTQPPTATATPNITLTPSPTVTATPSRTRTPPVTPTPKAGG